MKLALVTRRYPPLIGGAEKMMSYLAAALADEGAEVTVLTARPPGLELPEREEIAASSKSGRLTIERLPTSPARFVGTWTYMRELTYWFEQNIVDLAYVSMLKHDAYATLGAARRLGFPVVLRPEGAGATGDVAWQAWGRFGRRIGLRCREASAFVAISKAVEDEILASWRNGTMRPSSWDRMRKRPNAPPRIASLPNGVPVPAVSWRRRDDWRAAPVAAFVGRLAPEKGLDVLIDAWPLVRGAFPSARLVLHGEGPERPGLEARVRGLGLALGPGGAVEMPGAVADASGALRSADLFVLPSREEGMSIALLEAMALGMPIVASSIPNNRRLLSDFKHGRLADVDGPEALARTIIEQLADFDRAFHMGRAARARVERAFSARAVAARHLEWFGSIIQDSRFQIPDSRFQIPDSRVQIPDSRFQSRDCQSRDKHVERDETPP